MNLKDWRLTEKNWSQETLAKEIGTDKFTVCRWERGRNKPNRIAKEALKRIGYVWE